MSKFGEIDIIKYIYKMDKSKKIVSNIYWRFAENWGCQIVSFIITIVIARFIDPSDYGIVAIVNTSIQIFTVFVDGGLGNSLIQKKNTDDLDYSTVFYANLLLCSFLYLLIFFSAPFLENYYQMDSLATMLRVSSISLIIYSYKNILHAYTSKNMMFKKFFFSSLTGTIGAGVVGIVLACLEYGPWALVFSHLFDVIVDTVFIGISIKWRPKLNFSLNRFKSLFNFGWKILVSSFLERLFNKAYHLIIGKYGSSEELAYYDKANSLTSQITDNVDSVIGSVLFPAMSNEQDDKEYIKKITSTTLKIDTYIMFPMLLGIVAVCDPLVECLLTEKWKFAVPYIRVFCIINMLLPFQSININVIKSLGKSDIYLKQEISKKIISIFILVASIPFGSMYIVYGKLVSCVINTFINISPNKKLVNYGFINQIFDIMPNMIISIIMCVGAYLITFLGLPSLLTLIIQVVTGIFIYMILSIITKNESFDYLIKLLSKSIKTHK